jgi:hypothetical protein
MIFFDPILEQSFLTKGFVVIKGCFREAQLEQLLNYQIQFDPQLDSGFKTSVWSSNSFYRNQTFELLKPIYDKKLQGVLRNHHGIMGNYMIKEARTQSSIDIHADWAFTDETKHSAINAWIPLVDTSIENGCLRILPFSNQFNYPIRGRGIAHQFESLKDHMESLSEPILVKAGDAVLFNVKCIHYSNDNLSNSPRPAVSMVMVPDDANIIHYTTADKNQIRKIDVEDPYFFSNYNAFEEIPKQPKETLISFTREQFNQNQFDEIYAICSGKNTLKTKWNKLLGKHMRSL